VIYNELFDGLPDAAKDVVYQQLWDVLSGKEPYGDFKHLTAADRRAIREILRVTKPGLPEYWK
jgi:hypothetical protein